MTMQEAREKLIELGWTCDNTTVPPTWTHPDFSGEKMTLSIASIRAGLLTREMFGKKRSLG